MNSLITDESIISKAISTSWKHATEYPTADNWLMVIHKLDGMTNLLYWAYKGPSAVALLDCILCLLTVAHHHRNMAE